MYSVWFGGYSIAARCTHRDKHSCNRRLGSQERALLLQITHSQRGPMGVNYSGILTVRPLTLA